MSKKCGRIILIAAVTLCILTGCSHSTNSQTARSQSESGSVQATPSATVSNSPQIQVPIQLTGLDSSALKSVLIAFDEIGLDIGGVSNFEYTGNWGLGTGKTYTFAYSGSQVQLDINVNSDVYNVESGGVDVYHYGDESLNISDYVGSAELSPAEYPESGYLFHNNGKKGAAPFTAFTQDEYAFFVKLENTKDKNDFISFFVRPGETVDLQVPLGEYTVKYATGKYWYGEDVLFGPRTLYYQVVDPLSFTSGGQYSFGNSVALYSNNTDVLGLGKIGAGDF